MKKNLKKQALVTTAAIAGVALVGQVNAHADATNNSNDGSSNSQVDQQQSPEVKQAQQNLTSASNEYSSAVADKNAAQSAANSASDAQSAAQQKADQQAAAVSSATANEQKAASAVNNDQNEKCMVYFKLINYGSVYNYYYSSFPLLINTLLLVLIYDLFFQHLLSNIALFNVTISIL